MHAAWAARRSAGMRVLEPGDLVLVDSGLPCDTFNVVLVARFSRETAAQRISETAALIRTSGRPFAWWVSPGDEPPDLGSRLAAAGFQASGSELAMAVPLSGASTAPGSRMGGMTIERVRDADALRAFASVTSENWQPPDANVTAYFASTAHALLAPGAPLSLYVARTSAGEAVAAAELAITGETAGIYNVSTLAAFRGRGIAMGLVGHLLDEATRLGARLAVLQATEVGAGVYRRLGFLPFGIVSEYQLPIATEGR